MSRLNKTEDIIKLAMLFQNSYCGLCIDDIKDEFECSRRSAERMKSVLFDLFPDKIEEVASNDKKKRWRFIKGTMNTLISFSAEDFANLEYLKGLTNDETRQRDLNELIAKIKALTPQKNLNSLDTDVSAILESEGFAVRQYARVNVNKEIMDKLRNSLLAFKKISFDYKKNNNIYNVTLNPYGIIISDKYYLVGLDEQKNVLKLYKIDKINNLTVSDEYFEKDENFSLQEYCNKSFGIYQEEPMNITLEFDKSVAEDILNYNFHPTQKMKQLDNGDVQVKMVSGGKLSLCFELVKWGANVKIKKPSALKEYYADYLQHILDNI